MSKKYTTLNFKAKVKPIEKLSEDFMKCKCYAFGLGKNRNYSHVSKENMERNKYTLSYAPVVGHLIEKYDKDGNKIGRYMGGHDSILDLESWEFKSICVPYGVVIPNSFSYEIVKEYKDEKEREYLTCEVILWVGRYPELKEAMYSEDILFNESAELDVSEYRPLDSDSNYMDLIDFSFSALCLLGKADKDSTNGHVDKEEHTEPCFIESKLIPIQYSLAQDDFSKDMNELKEKLSFYFNRNEERKGEDDKMENTQTEVIENSAETEVVENSAGTEEVTEMSNNTGESNKDEKDKDSDENKDSNEDKESDEDKDSDEDKSFVENNSLKEQFESLKNEYNEYKTNHSYTNEEYSELNEKYEVLVEFKTNYDKTQKEKLFADEGYAQVSDTEEFKSLMAESDNLTYEECENKANAILGKFNKATFAALNKQKKQNRVVYGLNMPNENTSSIYGDFIKKTSK